MTNLQKFLIEHTPKCQFKYDTREHSAKLEIKNLLMFWTNFSGKPNRFNNDARNFNAVITPEVMKWFEETGKIVKVHQNPPEGKNPETGEEEESVFSINVKVKMDGPYPPLVRLFTDYRGNKTHVDLTEETVGCLDGATIISADCIINLSESKQKPGHYVCYLEKLYAIQEKRVEFDGKYDDWLDPEFAQVAANEEPSND